MKANLGELFQSAAWAASKTTHLAVSSPFETDPFDFMWAAPKTH